MSTKRNPYEAYSKTSLESEVAQASPHKLILMLFDGLLASINAARGAIERGELPAERAIETGVVEVLRGPGDLLGRFADTFHLAA